MKCSIVFFGFLCLTGPWVSAQEPGSAKARLDTLIARVEGYRPVDWKEHPLGVHTEARYKADADFAAGRLAEAGAIPADS